METGAAIGIAVGALILALYLTHQQEQQTAVTIAAAKTAAANPGGGDNGALSFGQVAAVVGTVAATYFGGVKAGASTAQALG